MEWRQNQLTEKERYQDELKFWNDQLELERERGERAEMALVDAQLKATGAFQMMEMQARNQESYDGRALKGL